MAALKPAPGRARHRPSARAATCLCNFTTAGAACPAAK